MRQTPQGRVDPDVKIPAAVRAAAAHSESFYKPQEPVNKEELKGEDQEGIDGQAGQPAKTEPEAPAEANPKGTVEPPAAPKDVTPQGNEENWEHRYNSMKGRYDRSQNDLRQQAERITQLERTIATIQVQAPSKSDTAPEQTPKFITPEMEEEWGKEFLEVVGKKAQEAYQPLVSTLERKVKDLELQLGKVGGHIAGDARSRMLADLDAQVTDWQQINTNPNFISWLQLPDTYSGAIRHQLLKEAFERNDSPRVAAFFKGFLAEEAAVAPAEGKPDPHGHKPSNKVPLENFAAPGRAKSAAATAPVEKPIISRAQITHFYAEVAAGKYRGNEDEQKRLERQIFEAQRDGRIQ